MNILIVRTDKLGDFVTALPTMYVLKKQHPQNRIIACVAPLNEALANACDFIDEVIVDRGEGLVKFSMRLRQAQIDVSITLFSNTRVALAQFMAGIPIRIAPATKIAQIFYNRRVKQRRSRVEMAEYEYNLELTKTLFKDIDVTFTRPLCDFLSDDIDTVYKDFISQYAITRPVIAFHPGFGGSSDANLTLAEYVDLVKVVSEDATFQAVMTFGPGEEVLREESIKLSEGLDVVFYTSTDGIVSFTKLLASFKLFVSTSTGTYHLAALVNIPTMTFFGDSLFASVKRWKAVNEEKKQYPFMLPTSPDKRVKMIGEISNRLKQWVDDEKNI